MFGDNNLCEITCKCKFDNTDNIHHNVTFNFEILQGTNNLQITQRTSDKYISIQTQLFHHNNIYRFENNPCGFNWRKNATVKQTFEWKISRIMKDIFEWPYQYWRVNYWDCYSHLDFGWAFFNWWPLCRMRAISEIYANKFAIRKSRLCKCENSNFDVFVVFYTFNETRKIFDKFITTLNDVLLLCIYRVYIFVRMEFIAFRIVEQNK